MLRYDRKTIERLTVLDSIAEELGTLRQQLIEEDGIRPASMMRKVNWKQFNEPLDQVQEVEGEDRTMKGTLTEVPADEKAVSESGLQ